MSRLRWGWERWMTGMAVLWIPISVYIVVGTILWGGDTVFGRWQVLEVCPLLWVSYYRLSQVFS